MAKVDRGALAAALDQLQREGVISGWQPRPLGMYIIGLVGGEALRPNAKETAMWVQGASYAGVVKDVGHAIEELPDREDIETTLEGFRSAGLVRDWRLDEDGDYIVVGPDGREIAQYATRTRAWLAGAGWGAVQSTVPAGPTREALIGQLNSLRDLGRVTAWSADDDQFRVWLAGRDDPIHLNDAIVLGAWLHGFNAAVSQDT